VALMVVQGITPIKQTIYVKLVGLLSEMAEGCLFLFVFPKPGHRIMSMESPFILNFCFMFQSTLNLPSGSSPRFHP
jgi:hypothetical protein